MRGYVANTDFDWFTTLRAIKPPIDEVNFWRPGETSFKALDPGEPMFFRLKSPHNAIGGFGYFAHFSRLPSMMAWDVYGPGNGAQTYADLRARLIKLRSRNEIDTQFKDDFQIGCVLVDAPVFFDEADWVRIPDDFKPGIQQGKTYDLASGEGQRIWLECLARAATLRVGQVVSTLPAGLVADRPLLGGYGDPTMIRPRLGQRSFRIAVLDSYARKCAVTNEKTLPALEAAHIRDYREVQEHTITNGILFRADIHKLFDAGYVTVTPAHRFAVSHRIKEEFENGRDYYALQNKEIRLPANPEDKPLEDALKWHNDQRFRG